MSYTYSIKKGGYCLALCMIGISGPRYPTNVYDGNRLSLSILRQMMAQSCGMMFIDLLDSC